MTSNNEQNKRAAHNGGKPTRKRECNWQRGVSIASNALVVCFAIIGAIFLILTLWNWFCTPCSEQNVAQPAALLERLRDVYLALFVGFAGMYFAILGILLGHKDHLDFTVCLRYISEPHFLKLHACLMLVNFVLLEFTPPLLAYARFASLYAIVAVVQCLWTFIMGVVNMTYMENPVCAAKLLNYFLRQNKRS